jgi:hypothetical protein
MTPAEIAAKWTPILSTFNAIAADIKGLTLGLAQRLTTAQAQTLIDTRVNALIGAAPAALDTLAEIAVALQGEQNATAAFTTTIASKASQVDHLALVGRVTDTEAILNGMPDFVAAYNAAKA